MKLFQIIRKKFAVLGISPANSIQKYPLNPKLVLVYFIYGATWSSSALFLYRKANTFEEYTNNIYVTSATAMIIITYTVVVTKMSKFFTYINNYGQTVERSEQI